MGSAAAPEELGTGRTLSDLASAQGDVPGRAVGGMSAAMRLWVAGQVALAADALLVAGSGYAGRTPGGSVLDERLLLPIVGLLLFAAAGALAVLVAAVRRSPWFWLAGSIPAVLWVPATPFVYLEAGPPLATPAGLALAAAGVVGAVVVIVSGTLAALETRASERPH